MEAIKNLKLEKIHTIKWKSF